MNNYQLLSKVPESIFRAYDIRGIVDETLNENIIYTIGHAIGHVLHALNQNKILIGYDGRLSSPSLRNALHAALLECGCEITDLGCVPTPLLYFALQFLNIPSGVMLTASHNPAEYNGLKIILNDETLIESQIFSLYETIIQTEGFKCSLKKGSVTSFDICASYIQYLKQDINIQKRLKVVLDCGNGVAGAVVPTVFKELGLEVIELFCKIDGNFPHHPPDPSHPNNLKDLILTVKTHQADVGIAFDGDGDRLVVVTNQGEIIWPDRLMMLYVQDILKQSIYSNVVQTVICDVKCSDLLLNWINTLGGRSVLWKTGHSLIKAKLKETHAILAGEMSGHIFFNDGRWFGFDDGLYAAARLLEILSHQNQSIHDIFLQFPNRLNTPELKIEMHQKNKFLFMENFKKILDSFELSSMKMNTIDGVRMDFDKGWGLIRASNTTECLVLRFEAEDEANLKMIQDVFRKIITVVDPELTLPY